MMGVGWRISAGDSDAAAWSTFFLEGFSSGIFSTTFFVLCCVDGWVVTGGSETGSTIAGMVDVRLVKRKYAMKRISVENDRKYIQTRFLVDVVFIVDDNLSGEWRTEDALSFVLFSSDFFSASRM